MNINKIWMITGLLIPLSSAVMATSCPEVLQSQHRLLNENKTIDLCDAFQGQTLLVVNTASQCGYTPQFEELERLYQVYKDRQFTVIGFPSNDFQQDRGSEKVTAKICYLDYGVTFPMMARSSVSGPQANPTFARISAQAGVEPRWNFYKFLIGKNGQVLATFPSSVSPISPTVTQAIEKAL
ncbi:glutathione peroxidase [Vibrio ostreicida]|nr:glutathione peroxidase [Vibrio ostreicida]